MIPKINSAHGADTRNLINRAIEVLNRLGIDVQTLVAEGQLTEEQYAQLITTINGLISKGNVSVNDIDINRGKLLPRHMSEEVLKMMTGDAPVNAVPADGSITRDKLAPKAVGEQQTSFISTNNLWDGIHHRYIYLQGNADAVRHTVASDPNTNHHSAVIRVEPEETYTVLKKEGGDRFNIAVLEKMPELNEDENALFVYRSSVSGAGQSRTRTITIPEGGRFLVIHTNTFTENLPDIVVSQGLSATEDEKLKFNKEIEGYPKLVKSEKNLFDGDYRDFGLLYTPTQQRISVIDNQYDGTKRKSAVVEVLPDRKYSITFPNKDHTWFRVAGFPSQPVTNSTADEIYKINEGGVKNPDDNILTITTGENIRFIVIYTSSDTDKPIEPALQVEFGEPTEYEPYEYIKPQFLNFPITKEENEEVKPYKKDARFNFYENLNVLYTRDPINDYFPSPNSLSADDFNQLYKDLAQEHPDKLEVMTEGQDDWGNEIISIETKVLNFNKVENGSGNDGKEGVPIPQPKFVITTGVHGHEKSAAYATYNFIKDLLENTEKNLLSFILSNIKLAVMPLCNPSGFNSTQRHNGNNIDINRNFNSRNPQTETIIIKDFLEKHSDMDFFIDYHTLIPRSTIIGYTVTNNKQLAYTANNMYRDLGRHWQKINPNMPQGREVIFSFTTPANLGGLIVEYAEDEYGVDSVVLELTNAYSYLAGGNYSEPVVRMGVEFLTNMITGTLRLRQ